MVKVCKSLSACICTLLVCGVCVTAQCSDGPSDPSIGSWEFVFPGDMLLDLGDIGRRGLGSLGRLEVRR